MKTKMKKRTTRVFKDKTRYELISHSDLTNIRNSYPKAFYLCEYSSDLEEDVSVEADCRKAQVAFWEFVAKECQSLIGFSLT